jgi:hypothetical protein
MQFPGNREDHVHMRGVQQQLLPLGQPALPLAGRALRAAAMLTGVILQPMDMSVGAAEQMAAQRGRTAIADSPARLELVVGQRPSGREVVEVLLEDLL